uniref:Gag protein n=1 Tax=Loa loa TaxID=7209 RepID=A0A1I7VPB1_LOALO
MFNKDFTIRCGLNTAHSKTTHAIQPDPNSTQSLATQNDSRNSPDSNSTQPNTTQHIQFKAANGFRKPIDNSGDIWPIVDTTLHGSEKKPPHNFLVPEVRCDVQVTSLPVFNQQKPGARSCPTTHGSSIFKPSLQRKKGKRRKRLTNASQRGKSKEQERSIPRPNLTVNLPQLSLPTFNGEPRQWRQFWSSFNAAVHSQTIPEIQKLNYLFSCLRGNALQVVSGYEIAPENYEVIRRLLKNKYGDPSTITTILYNELQAIKRNEKEWMTTIENIE